MEPISCTIASDAHIALHNQINWATGRLDGASGQRLQNPVIATQNSLLIVFLSMRVVFSLSEAISKCRQSTRSLKTGEANAMGSSDIWRLKPIVMQCKRIEV